jgi:hypothetical protein
VVRTCRARSVNSSVGIHEFDNCVYASNGGLTRVPRTSNARDVRGTYAIKIGLKASSQQRQLANMLCGTQSTKCLVAARNHLKMTITLMRIANFFYEKANTMHASTFDALVPIFSTTAASQHQH